MASANPFGAQTRLKTKSGEFKIYSLKKLADSKVGPIETLPFSIRVLLEACLRKLDNFIVSESHVRDLANWNAKAPKQTEVPFMPGRVVFTDFPAFPAAFDLPPL